MVQGKTAGKLNSPKAIIVGAGIAGLASAIRLSLQGFQVEIFEKNNYPGGKLSHFEKEGYQFDAGPSLFTQPHHIEALFELAGEPIENYFSYTPLPSSCKYFYEDGTIVNAFTDAVKFTTELHEKLGEDENKILAYLQQAESIYKNIGSIFLNHSLHKKQTLIKAPIAAALKATKGKYIFQTMNDVNASHFSNPKTVQLFNRYATYNGSNPYQAPSMLTLIAHLEHNEGIFYPKGGMISITNALYKLALKKGVHFHFNHAVQKIIHTDKKVTGIVANNSSHFANIVISNMDVYFTYKHLLGDEIKSKQLLKQERSSSAMVFYWGIKQPFAQLQLHNILFSNDYKAEFDALFKTKTCYKDPTIYINITSKCEAGIQAPLGKENWFVMVNAPANIGQDWSAFKQQYRKAIIQKINTILHTDIEPFIEVEETLDPIVIESNTASYMGSLYGTSSNTKMAAFLRHPNFTNAIKGLYFVGGSVHPGGGIPLCLQSAKIMSDIVKEDVQKMN